MRAKDLLTLYAKGERAFMHEELVGEDLSGADLTRINLFEADLRDANLSRVDFRAANLASANLSRANLGRASLFDANLYNANLEGADLRGADLFGADLTHAALGGASLGGLRLNTTNLLDIDLSPLCESVPPVIHAGPSRVDHRSIMKSLRSPQLKSFLQRTGMPEIFVEYMVDCARSVATDVFKLLRSTFICYGDPDEPFARRLYEALQRNGVTTFFFPEHAKPGEMLHRTMRKAIQEHDRVVLVCSRASLDRPGVLFQLEEVLAREARLSGESLLIPIRLDDYVFTGWRPKEPDVAQSVCDRVVADFTGAERDDERFRAGLQRLIAALRR